jgi:serine/threonine protein kinase/ankyrin repeat protein
METLHQSKDIIQHYRIIEVLGQGGVGITYLAEDTKTGCKVALKALSLRSSKDWKQMELFEREARILKQLNHPAIPRYIDYFAVDTPEDQTLYIVQEWAVGKSLADLVKQGWRTNEAGVRKIAIQVLEILVYLHSLEPAVIHRDIKPHNLVMSEDSKVSLVDFGAVQDTYYNTFMRGSTMVGTYGYMAPEQFRGQAVPATDLFALGATLLFLLTHRHPADLPHDRLRINFRSHLQVSDTFADWLEKMLEPDTDDRFASAQTALSAFKGNLIPGKFHALKPWKTIGTGSAIVAGLMLINTFKYTIFLTVIPFVILSNFGISVWGTAWGEFFGEVMDAGVKQGNTDAIRTVAWWTNRQDDYQLSPEAKESFKDVAEELIEMEAKIPVATAARWQNKRAVELLLSKGVDVNANDGEALQAAASTGNADMVQLLIEHGADVNQKNKWAGTALHSSFDKGIVELLLKHGAKVNSKNSWGATPLNHAIQLKDISIVELLLKHGAEVDITDKHGQPLLHYAIQLATPYRTYPITNTSGKQAAIEITNLLLKYGANVNTENAYGRTPLHYAVSANDPELVELLLKHGAKTNIKDKSGETPLDDALSNRNERIVKLLKEYGAEK